MQAVDTERIKLDDACWSVKCAECGVWFEAKRSDASFHSPACRKRWHMRPARKQAALADIASMAVRVRDYANTYHKSQDMLDALGALEALIRKQRAQMDVEWKQQELAAAPTPSTHLTQVAKLQLLIEQIPDLAAGHVEQKGKEYFVRQPGESPLYFGSFKIGQSWLKTWIDTGRRPPMAQLRQR